MFLGERLERKLRVICVVGNKPGKKQVPMMVNMTQERTKAGVVLRRGAWFRTLPVALQDAILQRSRIMAVKKGYVFWHADEPAHGLLGVLDGLVAQVHHGHRDKDPETAYVAASGAWLGFPGLYTDTAPSGVMLVARRASKVILLLRTEFERLVAEHPEFCPSFARPLAERAALTVRMLAETKMFSVDARLRLRLADLAELRCQETTTTVEACRHECREAILTLSQADLADIVGVSRSKLNRFLHKLSGEGLVKIDGRNRLRVPCPHDLRTSVKGAA